MRFARVAAAIFAFGILAVFTLAVSWFFLGGRDHLRTGIVDRLRPIVGDSFDIASIAIYPHSVVLKGVSLEPSRSMRLDLKAASIRVSPYTLLQTGFDWQGTIEEIELVEPRLTLLRRSVNDTTSSSDFTYKPFVLRDLSVLKAIKRVSVRRASIATELLDRFLVDDATGIIDVSDPSHVTANITAILPFFEETILDLDGRGDIISGEFFVKVSGDVRDLSNFPMHSLQDELKLEKGNLSVALNIWGGKDLRFDGQFRSDSLSLKIGDNVSISEGHLEGDIFGQRAEVKGQALVNDNPAHFEGIVSNLLDFEWYGDLEMQVDASTISKTFPDVPDFTGDIAAEGKFKGSGTDWSGNLLLASKVLTNSIINLEDLSAGIEIRNGVLRADSVTTRIGDGVVNLSGEIDPITGYLNLQGDFENSWSGSEIPNWCSLTSPNVYGSINIQRKEGIWLGSGEGGLRDGNGPELVSVSLSSAESEFLITVRPIAGIRDNLSIDYLPRGKITWRLAGYNPHLLLREIIKPEYVPAMLYEYSVGLKASGSDSKINVELNGVSSEQSRTVDLTLSLLRRPNSWGGDAEVQLTLPNRSAMIGKSVVEIDSTQIKINGLTVRTDRGDKLCEGAGLYRLDLKKFERYSLSMKDLPLVELIRFVSSDIEPGFGAAVDFTLLSDSINSNWSGEARIVYPDSLKYRLLVDGSISNNSITLNRATLTSASEDTVILSASGKYYIDSKKLEKAVVSLSSFNLDRAIEIVAPSQRNHFGGVLNARIEADGPVYSPGITADLHLTSGLLYGESGYWANMTLSGVNNVYDVSAFNVGYRIKALLNGSGNFDLNNKVYQFDANGANSDISRLVFALSGLKIPLDGFGNLNINVQHEESENVARGSVEMSSGSFGSFQFNQLSSKLSLRGFDSGSPVLAIDSLLIDWGDVLGTVKGELELSDERSIDMTCKLDGRLLSFLPKLTHSFSRTTGVGQINLTIGGSTISPQIKEGSFLIYNGGFKLNNVIREVNELNADISLHKDGNVSVNQFDFRIDDSKIQIANRLADTSSGEVPIVIAGLNVGVLRLLTSPNGFWIVIPALMEDDWGGYVGMAGFEEGEWFEFSGPASRPLGVGEVSLRNAIATYPFIHGSGKPNAFARAIVGLLERMRWNVNLTNSVGCRYFREISGLGELQTWEDIKNRIGGGLLNPGIKITVDVRVDDNPVGVRFTGSVRDTLHISGEFTSSQGSIEFLDLVFDVEKVGVLFNPALMDPVIYGTAVISVLDTSNISRQVRIRIGGSSGSSQLQPTEATQGARFSDLTLTFEDDQGHSQEQVLGLLGYAPDQLSGKLTGLGTQFVESASPLKKWQRGFERRLEQWTGLDRISVRTSIAQNFLDRQFNPVANQSQSFGGSYWNLLYGSRVTLGKYILPNLYVSYTGALATQSETYSTTRLGIQHTWDTSYRLRKISNNLVLNYRYEYNELALASNSSLLIRYGWFFSLQSQLSKVWK